MRTPALLLALAILAFGASARAQEQVPVLRPTLDPFLVASNDPLTRAVLRGQLAQSGGVVSAVLHKGANSHVDYQGSATPVEGLSLPPAAAAAGPKACAAEAGAATDWRDAPAAKPAKGKRLQRAIAADQLLSVVREMKPSDKAAADRAWERRERSRRR